jgi:hypothetical protein
MALPPAALDPKRSLLPTAGFVRSFREADLAGHRERYASEWQNTQLMHLACNLAKSDAPR